MYKSLNYNIFYDISFMFYISMIIKMKKLLKLILESHVPEIFIKQFEVWARNLYLNEVILMQVIHKSHLKKYLRQITIIPQTLFLHQILFDFLKNLG